jgi:hypothetical protein
VKDLKFEEPLRVREAILEQNKQWKDDL